MNTDHLYQMQVRLNDFIRQLMLYSKTVNNDAIIPILDKAPFQQEHFRFLYTMLFRINTAIESGTILFQEFYNKQNITNSLVLLLRASMSDILTLQYILIREQSGERFERDIKIIHYDHIKWVISGYKGVYGRLYDYTEEDIRDKISGIKKSNPDFFDETGDPIFKKTEIFSLTSAVDYMQKILKKQKEGRQLSHVKLAYKIYDIFSKYEHLGELSFTLIHKSFDNRNNLDLLRNVLHSFYLMTFYIDLVTYLFKKDIELNDQLIKKQFTVIEDKLQELMKFIKSMPELS